MGRFSVATFWNNLTAFWSAFKSTSVAISAAVAIASCHCNLPWPLPLPVAICRLLLALMPPLSSQPASLHLLLLPLLLLLQFVIWPNTHGWGTVCAESVFLLLGLWAVGGGGAEVNECWIGPTAGPVIEWIIVAALSALPQLPKPNPNAANKYFSHNFWSTSRWQRNMEQKSLSK